MPHPERSHRTWSDRVEAAVYQRREQEEIGLLHLLRGLGGGGGGSGVGGGDILLGRIGSKASITRPYLVL